MRAERDDLAAAAEYICLRLHPEELRIIYVTNVRGQYAAGDPPDLIMMVLQELDVGLTDLFIGLLGSFLYDKFKKPDSNIERLLNGQRSILARFDALISKEPGRASQQFSDPTIAAMVDDALKKQMERARVSQQFHESMILKIQDSDPAIAAMVDDALRQLEARGAKALVNDVHAAGNCSAVPAENAPMMRWWHRPD